MSEAPSELKKILRNAASVLLGSAGGELLTTYALGLAAVGLGPAGFGVLSTARAFTEPFQSIAGFGMGTVALTLAARRGGLDAALRGTVFYLSLGFAVLATGLSMGLAALTGRGGPMPVVALATVATALVPLNAAASLPFTHERRAERLIFVPTLVGLFRLATAWAAWRFVRSAFSFQLSATASGVLSALLTLGVSWRHYGLRFTFDRALARRLLSMAWPAAAVEFVVMAYMRASYFFLHDAGPRVQGEYAAADQLSRPVLTLAGVLMVSALPTVARIAADRAFEALTTVYRKSLVRALLVLVPLASVVWWLAPAILTRAAPAYASAATPFRVLLFGTLCMCLNQLSSTFIVAMGRFRLILVVALINFAVYVVLARWAIPRYQATGAAIATAVMEGVNSLMQLVIVALLLRDGRRQSAQGPKAEQP